MQRSTSPPAVPENAAVAYVRTGVDPKESTPNRQRAEIARLAKREGYRVVREYYDAGVSGDATENRSQFKQMLHDAGGLGDFRTVLCLDQSRFRRFDMLEAGYWIKPLRKAHVTLVTVAEGEIDWDDFSGHVIWHVENRTYHQPRSKRDRLLEVSDILRNVTPSMKVVGRLARALNLRKKTVREIVERFCDPQGLRLRIRATAPSQRAWEGRP